MKFLYNVSFFKPYVSNKPRCMLRFFPAQTENHQITTLICHHFKMMDTKLVTWTIDL